MCARSALAGWSIHQKVVVLITSPADAQERVSPPEGMFWTGKLVHAVSFTLIIRE